MKVTKWIPVISNTAGMSYRDQYVALIENDGVMRAILVTGRELEDGYGERRIDELTSPGRGNQA